MKFFEKVNGYQIIEQINPSYNVFKAKKGNKFFAVYISIKRNDDTIFEHDIKKIIALKNTNIRTVYDVGKINGSLYYVKQYFSEYNTIFDNIYCQGRTFNESNILQIIIQIAKALDYASQFKIIHGLLHPNKIIISNEIPYVCLANRRNYVIGRPMFASPERVMGKDFGLQSDIFSLGSISYFMATGEFPFKATPSVLLLQEIMKKEPKAITKYNPSISSKTCKVIKKMMAKSLKKRYQNYSHLLQDLQNILC
ncbi:protein kinase [Candidatus Uabimicrobium sp. HlEnr_7]|uniref:protein kinase domain-containing protein n=1 Tax=Candidatus Uabimicrobium helgolandensis TaxID=3095367 RepID=UPI003556A2F7